MLEYDEMDSIINSYCHKIWEFDQTKLKDIKGARLHIILGSESPKITSNIIEN